ncbi:MAG TPA: DoxX subfamily [Polyangia bacterium]|nr:DoxX subfamily [Polyangia bacterium]
MLASSRSFSSFQQVTLIGLRTLIGWHFLYEGVYKFKLSQPAWSPDGSGPMTAWSSSGFLQASTGPFGKLAHFALAHGWLPWIDKLVMIGVAAVGLSLILGLFTRTGCAAGLLLLSMFYLLQVPTSGMPQPHAEGNYLLVNKTLIEGIAVLVLLAFDTGRIAGLDRLWRERPSRLAAVPAQRISERTVGQGSGT